MALTSEQQAQVEKQLTEHHHRRYSTDLILTDGEVLEGYVTHPDVYRSDVMSAGLFLGRFLFFSNGLFAGKRVLDLGCGSALQGVVMGRYGAASGVLSDISAQSVQNAAENLEHFGLSDRFQLVEGDLFERVSGRFDVIVFNHPFFPADPLPDLPVSRSMLDSGDLFQRFLGQATAYLNSGGCIITTFLSLAGSTNDPAVQAPLHGYRVEVLSRLQTKYGLQRGELVIYKLLPIKIKSLP